MIDMKKLTTDIYIYILKIAIALIVLLVGIAQSSWAQCATCKSAAATRDEAGNLVVGQGINTGILYLLAMPFIIGGIIGFIWWKYKSEFEKSASQ